MSVKQIPPDIQKMISEVKDFINEDFICQSVLYDLNLLPEQLEENTKEWSRMLCIACHIKDSRDAGRSSILAQLKEAAKDLITKEDAKAFINQKQNGFVELAELMAKNDQSVLRIRALASGRE